MAGYIAENGNLVWRKDEISPVGHGQLRIQVEAAGVNRPDLLQRAGLYPPPEGASPVLGLEVAGTVIEEGPGLTRFAKGDRVMALLPGGGYADEAVADEGCVLPLPTNWSFAEGAAFPETAFTVFTNVFEDGRLQKGERLFVHGATSGIATMACAIATARGHEVYGTAGTDEKVRAGQDHGFAKVWNYKTEDWSAAMQDLGGCDVVLDMVGGDYVAMNLAMLRPGGRHVSIAFLGGMQAEISVVDIMRRRLTLTGSTLRARDKAEKARLASAVENALLPLAETGKLKPLISLSVPMAEADKAHEAMQSGDLIGKAVLLRDESLLS